MDLIVGIDFSSNSIGVTFSHGGKIEYLSILNRWQLTTGKEFKREYELDRNVALKNLLKIGNFQLEIFDRKPNSMVKSGKSSKKKKSEEEITLSKKELTRWGITHLEQCMYLSEFAFKVISDKITSITRRNNITKIYCAIEHYSYSSESDNLIQMVEFTYPLKISLVKMLGRNNFFLISGPEIKMLAGNGNWDKFQMYQAFQKEGLLDECSSFISENESILTKDIMKNQKPNKDVAKPVDDLIDSYFIAKWLEINLSTLLS